MSCLGVHPALNPYVGEPSGGLPLCQHSGESQESSEGTFRFPTASEFDLLLTKKIDGGNIYTVTTGCVIAAMVTKMQLHYSFYEPPMPMIYAIIETHTHTWSDLPSMTMTPNKQYLLVIYICSEANCRKLDLPNILMKAPKCTSGHILTRMEWCLLSYA